MQSSYAELRDEEKHHDQPFSRIQPPLPLVVSAPTGPSSLPSSSFPLSPPILLSAAPALSPRPTTPDDLPVLPFNEPGTGAHSNCSATCVLSHPSRSAFIFLVTLFSIVSLAVILLIIVKAVRGDVRVEPTASSSSTDVAAAAAAMEATSSSLPNCELLTTDCELTLAPVLAQSRPYKSTSVAAVTGAASDLSLLLDRLEHSMQASPLSSLSSITPKVPDDGDMVSAMIMLMWGLSPLVSAIVTISWTYYTYRHKLQVGDEAGAAAAAGGGGGSAAGGEETSHRHHHHPMLVNPSPILHSDEGGSGFELFPQTVGMESPTDRSEDDDTERVVQQPVGEEEVEEEEAQPQRLSRPPAIIRSQSAIVTSASALTRRNVSPPRAERAPAASISLTPTGRSFPAAPPLLHSVTAPSLHRQDTVSRQRCRRTHVVHPFYSRVSPPRPRWWFVPTSREHFLLLWRPLRRFLLRCYLLPTLIPTVTAIAQYLFSCSFRLTGWLSTDFVPTLTSALSFPDTVAGEVWAVVLAFCYELFLGCWWDPFPPGSADWGKGMNFHGASWLALTAMEEIGWAGLLFPCLYELYPHNPTRASLITGVLWSAWHWPFLVFGQAGWLPDSAAYHPGLLSTPFLYGFITFTLSTTCSRVIMVRLLLWSDDLWSQCVYHAAHNVMVFNFFAQLPEVRADEFPYAGLFIAEAGVPVVLCYLAVAAWTIKGWYDADERRRSHQQQQEQEQRGSSPASLAQQRSGETGAGSGEVVMTAVGGGAGAGRPFVSIMSPIYEENSVVSHLEERKEDGRRRWKKDATKADAGQLNAPLLSL